MGVMLTVKVLLALLAFAFSCPASQAAERKFTLVIDAGHGGKDGGACANGAKEKNINLAVALAFGKLVEKNCSDVKVIYTRKTDVFIPLHERADIANRNKADAFISIHTNSVASKRPISGMETYTMGMRRSDEKLSAAMRENEVVLIESDYKQHYAGFDPRVPESYIIFDIVNETNMAQSVELAQLIQQKVCATAKRPNKGVKQDAFLVLRETSMPACLIELGYITTASEAAYLTNPANVEAMGRGIYQAFVAYKDKRSPQAQQKSHTENGDKDSTATEKASKDSPATEKTAKDSPATEKAAKDSTATEKASKDNKVTEKADNDDAAPVFKVQLLASVTKLKTNDRQLKGLTGVECYKEGRMWKYTLGSSTDYNEIYRLRKSIIDKFPQAFIIAFKNGERVDVNAARQEAKRNSK